MVAGESNRAWALGNNSAHEGRGGPILLWVVPFVIAKIGLWNRAMLYV